MSFRYRSRPVTHNALVAGLVLAAVGAGSTEPAAAAWSALVRSVPERALLTGGLMVLHTAIFWPVCLAFHYVDTHDRPAWIARHRIQPDKRKHPDLPTTVRVLLRNQFLILPVLLFGFGEVLLAMGWRAEAELPTLPRLALELVALGVCSQVVFYAGHRFLHRKWWMRHVHRVHHEFRATTAFASEYAHPFEFVVGNFLALVAGPLIFHPHLATMYLFTVLALVTILVHHSGYALPWAPWSVPHDWHHYRFNELFGTTGFLDRLLGTDAEFRTLRDGEVR